MFRRALHVAIMSNVFGNSNHHPCYRHTLKKPLAPLLVDCIMHRPKLSSKTEIGLYLLCATYSRTAESRNSRKPGFRVSTGELVPDDRIKQQPPGEEPPDPDNVVRIGKPPDWW
jgi:hypothetical protein